MTNSKALGLKTLAWALPCAVATPASPALADQPDCVRFFTANSGACEV